MLAGVRPAGAWRAALGSVEKHNSTVLFLVFSSQIPLDFGTELAHLQSIPIDNSGSNSNPEGVRVAPSLEN
jgi:hypothetical protein